MATLYPYAGSLWVCILREAWSRKFGEHTTCISEIFRHVKHKTTSYCEKHNTTGHQVKSLKRRKETLNANRLAVWGKYNYMFWSLIDNHLNVVSSRWHENRGNEIEGCLRNTSPTLNARFAHHPQIIKEFHSNKGVHQRQRHPFGK